MSADEYSPPPHVLGATHEASATALELLPSGVNLESAVGRAIARGKITPRTRLAERAVVALEGNVIAFVRRDRSPVSGRQAWKIWKVKRVTGPPR